MGHHINGDAWRRGTESLWYRELRADDVAGWVLAAVGCPTDYLECVLTELAVTGGPTHPPAATRRIAIRDGFDRYLRPNPYLYRIG
jgi:hypothetical protein